MLGQHQQGVLLFKAKDENGDGKLDLDQVLKGRLNAVAWHYVDAGGAKDQSLQAGGRALYTLAIPAKGVQELAFFVAAEGGSAPTPDTTAWTVAKLRRAAHEVWKDWPKSL